MQKKRRVSLHDEYEKAHRARAKPKELDGSEIFGAVNPWDPSDEYNDPRFVSIDMSVLKSSLDLYDRDCDIQTFSNASLNNALSGGILFTRKGHLLREEARDWHNAVWSRWTRAVERMLFVAGFCVCSFVEPYGLSPVETHARHTSEPDVKKEAHVSLKTDSQITGPTPKRGRRMPTVLSVEHLEIKYCLDVHGEPHFRVWSTGGVAAGLFGFSSAYGQGFGLGDSVVPTRVPNVRVWVVDSPDRHGRIRSKFATLLADILYENHLLHAAFIADQLRAQPPLVTQRLPQSKAPTPAALGSSATPTCDSVTNENRGGFYGDGNKPYSNASGLVELLNVFNSDTLESMTGRVNSMLQRRINNSASEQVYIEDGRQLVSQVLPEAPHDIILGFRQSRMVRVALVFGITMPSLTKTASAEKGGVQVKAAGNAGKDEDGSNSLYSVNFQREMKQRMIAYIRQMYRFIHSFEFATEALRDAKATGKLAQLTREDLEDEIGVCVSFPGQPEDAMLSQLYKAGMLTYAAYINYMSTKHSIPIENFHEKPQLSIREINNISEPEREAVKTKDKPS